MSKTDRERARTGMVFRDSRMVRAKDVRAMQQAGVEVLKRAPTSVQVETLDNRLSAGTLKPSAVREALAAEAPRQMHKGAVKLARKKKPVTVDALLEEYHGDAKFQEVAASVGLDEDWFTALAEAECKLWEGDTNAHEAE